jgi:hypothetical protein
VTIFVGEVQYGASDCAAPVLRDLAAKGAAGLRLAAFELAMPLVWERHTRALEMRKGHYRCVSGIGLLAPECADGFTDDLMSVVIALLSYRRPIANVEGWITVRMANAIKDGHRVRRAREMGAQQRVRVPARVAALLGDDPWLVMLAGRVLQWAGVRQTAGAELWPLGAWAEDRAALTGPAQQAPVPEATVADDIDAVLRAMKNHDPGWYDSYVERPLGRKCTPVAGDDWRAGVNEAEYLQLVSESERDDARLAEAAVACLAMIRRALAVGVEPRKAITEALTASFLSVQALRADLDRTPGGDDPGDLVAAILADRDALDGLVSEVLAVVG